MVNKINLSYKGMMQDVTKSKHPFEFYYDAKNIKITTTESQTFGSVTNEKGNELIISIPDITINNVTNVITYGTKTLSYLGTSDIKVQIAEGRLPLSSTSQKIIALQETRDSMLVFSTDSLGMDCIWELRNILSGDFQLDLLYLRDLDFSSSSPIQTIFNYENQNIQKVYWVDGVNQIRFLNIKHNLIEDNEEIIDIPHTSIDFVGIVSFSQPIVTEKVGGGNHTSGMVQYAYNLYRLNSSQTKISPLSDLVSLDKGLNKGGGAINEIVGTTPIVTINNIDQSYTNIKVYAIKYTSYNTIPSISLIEEKEISGTTMNIYDDGSVISTLSLEEFIFLGSDPIVPKHIRSKDNRLFPINIKTKIFVLPDELDTRAYSFPISSTSTTVFNQEEFNSSGIAIGGTNVTNTYNVLTKHDSINNAYDTKKYQYNSTVLGGEGKYIKYEVVRKSLTNPQNYKVFKDNEIHRIGVQFYNRLGQVSLPKWIADFKSPEGNLQGTFNTLKVTLKPAFYTLLGTYPFASKDDIPVGYKIIRAERKENDKTILAQGILTPMMFQVVGPEAEDYTQFHNISVREYYQDEGLKFPSFLSREFNKIPVAGSGNNGKLQEVKHLEWSNDKAPSIDEGGEIYTVTDKNNKISQTFQHTKMLQMYSPEILFGNTINFTSDLDIRVKGLVKSTRNGVYAEEREIDTKIAKHSGRSLGGINPWWITPSEYIENNNFRDVYLVPEGASANNNNAFIGPSGDEGTMNFKQYYREFNTFINDSTKRKYPIYGAPELVERGAESRFYNNDTKFKYNNSLQSIISDGEDDCDECDPISSLNTHGSQALTIVLGQTGEDTNNRKSLEEMYDESSLTDTSGLLMVEIIRKDAYIYLGNIFGGNTYEDKRRTSYIEIGSYNPIENTFIQIDSPGDTFVQRFKFLRMAKTDIEIYDTTKEQLTEIVEYYTETTIDLKNRNDISLNEWDSRFQPREDEYHLYNRVYSQSSNLVKNTDIDYNFKKEINFDVRIQSTKLKIPNEFIDSWTDILVNEIMDMDGKYGPINGTVDFNDNVYILQDRAVALISINPKVTITSTDGTPVELGTGNILDNYKYITTSSGTVNKWSTLSTNNGFYYFDALNKAWMLFNGQLIGLPDVYGMSSYFKNYVDYNVIKADNPILKTGVSTGSDPLNNDVFLTVHQGEGSFTICYNEMTKSFVSFHTYIPSIYANKGFILISTNPDNNKLYEHSKGEYNKYYGVYDKSYITFQVNPNETDNRFNNIEFKSQILLNGVDVPNKTITHIKAWNEYQETAYTPLVLNNNIDRKFRMWRAQIPRVRIGNAPTLDRMRGHWIMLQLSLENNDNHKLILHDVGLYYTPYQ